MFCSDPAFPCGTVLQEAASRDAVELTGGSRGKAVQEDQVQEEASGDAAMHTEDQACRRKKAKRHRTPEKKEARALKKQHKAAARPSNEQQGVPAKFEYFNQ